MRFLTSFPIILLLAGCSMLSNRPHLSPDNAFKSTKAGVNALALTAASNCSEIDLDQTQIQECQDFFEALKNLNNALDDFEVSWHDLNSVLNKKQEKK